MQLARICLQVRQRRRMRSSKNFCTIANFKLGFASSMNFRFATLLPRAFVWLSCLLIVGCITITPPPNPPGVVQVWVEPEGVRVLRNGETVSFVRPKYRNVERWRFALNDTAIVIKSRGRRDSPAAVQLFDIETGALREELMAFSLYTGQPAWARGFEEY
jgi:hypothetical protein